PPPPYIEAIDLCRRLTSFITSVASHVQLICKTETDSFCLGGCNMGLEHIGVHRLYELALNLEMFEESDFRHLEWCKECLQVFKALSQYDRFKTDIEPWTFNSPKAVRNPLREHQRIL